MVEADIFERIAAKYFLSPIKMKEVFDAVKLAFAHPRAEPHDYGRNVWFSETFRIFHIHEPIHEWVQYYWDSMFSLVRVFPGTYQVLEQLRERYTLCILTDSDGDVDIKLRRIEQLDLSRYFDHVFTSDAAGHNKPHPRMFLQVLEHYRLAAEDCVMIGDAPEVDLATAKELGMRTVWQKQGAPKAIRGKHFPFVDAEAETVQDLPGIIDLFARSENPLKAAAPLPLVRQAPARSL
jgi:HAD superfamily hydrolase (TIGR01509 family)